MIPAWRATTEKPTKANQPTLHFQAITFLDEIKAGMQVRRADEPVQQFQGNVADAGMKVRLQNGKVPAVVPQGNPWQQIGQALASPPIGSTTPSPVGVVVAGSNSYSQTVRVLFPACAVQYGASGEVAFMGVSRNDMRPSMAQVRSMLL